LARQRVLGRVRAAIGGGQRPGDEVDAEYAALPRRYLRAHHDPASHDIVSLFAQRAADYRAVVERVSVAALPGAIARVAATRAEDTRRRDGEAPMQGRGCGNVDQRVSTLSQRGHSQGEQSRDAWFAVPAGLPPGWLAELAEPPGLAGVAPAVRLVDDDPPLSAQRLDSCAGVITGCAVAIAETGTIVLDHGRGQGRRALTLVPDFHLVVVQHDQIAADLPDALARLDPSRPQTLIAGPSATSDIELIRVEGVHGPRTLHVLITVP
jgi:L-lactate dehydrogenase complex protein LldG